MAVTITKISGIGGNPPTGIQVEGTASGCEKVYVTVSCSTDPVVPIDIPTGGNHPWSVTYKNSMGCSCGDLVTASASCTLGFPAGDTKTVTLPLNCDPPCCDEVTIAIDTRLLPCIPEGGGSVSVQFSAALLPAGCPGGTFEWKVTNLTTGVVPQQFSLGGPTFSYPFPVAATYKVNVRVQQATTCDDPVLTNSVTFKIDPCTPCSVIVSGPTLTPCTDGPPTPLQAYTATTTPAFAGPYTWEVRDTAAPATTPPLSPTPITGGTTFSFAFPGPGTYKVTVSLQTNGCANPTAADSLIVTVPPCTMTPTPTTTTPTTTTPTTTTPTTTTPTTTTPTTTTPTPTTTPGGGFSLCCFLIWWWGISHLVAGSLLYFGLWWGGLISAAVATIVLVIWIAVCCWPCALTFWRCCTLLRWIVMFNDALVVILFAFFALASGGIPVVLLVFGLVSAVVRMMMSASNCGAIPNIFDPTTWPPCRCP